MKRRVVIALAAGLGCLVLLQPIGCHYIENWFGPPARELSEAYSADAGGAAFDHGVLDRVLRAHVTDAGRVRYGALVEDSADLDRYVAQLARVDFEQLGRDEKLALLINAYNAFTLRLILDHWPLQSIRDIPAAERWDARRWRIGDLQVSLTELEHEFLRKKFREPRIHFAINCASIGCPPLRVEAYTAGHIEAQLQAQAIAMHADRNWFELDTARRSLRLTRLYLWFAGDFEQVSGSVLAFAARFRPELAAELQAGREPSIEWLEYDWSINGSE